MATSNVKDSPITVNVKEFGAVGNSNYFKTADNTYWVDDGFTIAAHDDEAAIAAAIIACPDGGVVYFPKGNYSTGQILIEKSLKLLGESRVVSKLFITTFDGSEHFIWFKNDNVNIERLYVDAKGDEQSADTGSAIQVGSGTTTVYSNVVVRDCNIISGGFDAIGFWNVDGGIIEDNIILGEFDEVIGMVEATKNVTIRKNTITSQGLFGIAMDTADTGTYALVSNITIDDNEITCSGNTLQAGILIEGATDIIASNNKIDLTAVTNVGNGIKALDVSKRIAIYGNRIQETDAAQTQFGILIDGTAVSGADKDRYCTISNNIIYGTDDGIRVDEANAVEIIGNNIGGVDIGIKCIANTEDSDYTRIGVVSNNIEDVDVTGIEFNGYNGTSEAYCAFNHFTSSGTYDLAVNGTWTVYFYGKTPGSYYNDGTLNIADFTAV